MPIKLFEGSKYSNIQNFIMVWAIAIVVLAVMSALGGRFGLAVVDLLMAAGCYGFAKYGTDLFPE